MPGSPNYGDALAREITRNLPKRISVTIGHADLTAAALTQTINLGSPLPAGAQILGRSLRLTQAFSGGSVSALVVDIGGTDADAIVDGESVFTGATTAKAGISGIDPNGVLGGQQLTATFIATGANVVDLTAGSVTIDILYAVPTVF
jgi:hypothetical protein